MTIPRLTEVPSSSRETARLRSSAEAEQLALAVEQEFPVEEWLAALDEDLENEPLPVNYESLSTLHNLSQDERNNAALNIIHNYGVEISDISLPPGKITLAAARDRAATLVNLFERRALPQILEHDWTPAELLVLLYSARDNIINEHANCYTYTETSASKQFGAPITSAFDVEIIDNTAIISGRNSQITVYFSQGLPESREQWSIIFQACQRIIQMNGLVRHPVTVLVISDFNSVSYGQVDELEIRKFGDPNNSLSYRDSMISLGSNVPANVIEHIITHEMSHHLFHCFVENNPELAAVLENIYTLSLGFNRFEIADDSNYINMDDLVGHPHENPDELFASFSAAYYMHPEELLAFMNDLSTPADTRQMGIALWCFMRDNIFDGEVFAETDPFDNVGVGTALSRFSSDDVVASLEDALNNGIPQVRAAAYLFIQNNQLSDERLSEAVQQYQDRVLVSS